jgi:hypothetical protein
VEGIQTCSLELAKSVAPEADATAAMFKVREFQEGDRAQVLAIARSAHVPDRYRNDCALGLSVAARVYGALIDLCCRQQIAKTVLAAEECLKVNAAVLGFIICKMDSSRGVGTLPRRGFIHGWGSRRPRSYSRFAGVLIHGSPTG